MARSLGQSAYRALSRRGEAPRIPAPDPRPEGELVWIHAGEPGTLIAIQDLAGRLCTNRTGLSVLITHNDPDAPPLFMNQIEHQFYQQVVPDEHPQSVAAFLEHWRPDACLWTWGGLRPNLVLETGQWGCPMILLGVETKGFDGRRDRWLPELTREMLATFGHVMARSEAGRKRLVQLGLLSKNIALTAGLTAGGQALPCANSDLTDLAEAMGGRPVWFATKVQPSEMAVVLSAHRQALRLSHRLLLILNPATADYVDKAAHLTAEAGFDVIHWDDGFEPDDNTQVMITGDPADRGLFYRVAPVSFLGSSLVPDAGGCDPLEAAALGSAVLYGPKVRHFLPSYTRLAAAGAARIVNDASALGTAVSRLIAPDQAAAMAHAGWEVISQGAELTDRVVDLVQDVLDQRMGSK